MKKNNIKNVAKDLLTFTLGTMAVIGFIAVLFASAVEINAATTDVNIEGMSVEDMVKLRDELNVKIAENGGDNVIVEGDYVVGKDIKASNFKVTCHGEDGVMFEIVSEDEYDGMNTSSDAGRYFILYDGESGALNLKEGEVLMVSGSDYAIIEEVKTNFAP